MVNSPTAHGKRWFNSTCQSHDLLEAILAGQIKQGGHSDAVITASECQNQGKGHTDVLICLMAGSSRLKTP